MSKEFTKEDIIKHKKESIKALNRLLEGYINEPSGKHLKKAHLISFWIKNYVDLINFEETFDPTRNISYKRGNIVKINFGFNVGSEYGGLHYGVVLDNQNDHNSPVLTVIPLTSIKEEKTVHPNSVALGNEIYKSLKIKYDTISQSLEKEQNEIVEMIALSKILIQASEKSQEELSLLDATDPTYQQKYQDIQTHIMAANKLDEIWKERNKHNQEEQDYLAKIGDEISRMKKGSIALVNQITTVSKMRIFDPRNLRGVLSGISLSEDGMEKINAKLKELYVFEK